MDGKGCPPPATSRTALNTKKAASVGARRAITKFDMKFATSVWNDASQGVPIPPPGSATPTPNVLNQPRSDWRVAKTTAQNIHFVKHPPIMKELHTSRPRLIPANTSESRA